MFDSDRIVYLLSTYKKNALLSRSAFFLFLNHRILIVQFVDYNTAT